ncbi:hypothetical protein E0H26_02600 [Micromonospora zingiberis]|uniref:Uncharacterized protein n=1 Tax=Micromonospora zingiberis TaxID=2053011 RepID=A0A4R0GU24_9ACTN|nr:hypothetical protein [Micromonospora zingiberis]TCC00588.1 hypothetical protein E0H26_02600 [Micromonospora zingiberis]
MSIGEVKAALAQAHQSLDQAGATVEGVGTDLDEVSALVLATLHDSQRAEAAQARKAIADAIREVKLTLRVIAAAADNGSAYRDVLG